MVTLIHPVEGGLILATVRVLSTSLEGGRAIHTASQGPRNEVSSLAALLTFPRMPTPEVHITSHGKRWTLAQETIPECLPIACLEPFHTTHVLLGSLGISPWLLLCLFPREELVTMPQTLSTDLRLHGTRFRHHLMVPNTDVSPKTTAGAVSPGARHACVCQCSVVSDSHGLQPTRLPCPWNFPGKNTGVDCHFLLQRVFPTQVLNPSLLCLLN